MDRVDCGKFFYTLPISWYISQEIIKRKKKGLLIDYSEFDKLMLVALKDAQVATKVTGPGFCEERERQALEEATILASIARYLKDEDLASEFERGRKFYTQSLGP
jgi:hypothetical protein